MKCPKCGFEMYAINNFATNGMIVVQYMCRNKKCSEFGGKDTKSAEKVIEIVRSLEE